MVDRPYLGDAARESIRSHGAVTLARDLNSPEAAHQIPDHDRVAVVAPAIEFCREQRRVPARVDPQVEPIAAPHDVRTGIDAHQAVDTSDLFDEIAVDEDNASLQERRDAVVAGDQSKIPGEELPMNHKAA